MCRNEGTDIIHVSHTHVSSIWARTKSYLWGSNRKSRDWKLLGSMFCACPAFRVFFSYYSSSTTYNTVVQVAWLPEVTEGHVIPSGLPSGAFFYRK
jgi:hypothetical protein